MAKVQIKKLKDNATLPTTGSAYAAGYDLYACLDGDGEITIPSHHTVKIPTGVAAALPEGTFGGVFARSGLASKFGITMANGVGVIDSDYRGEVKVILVNLGSADFTISHGERIAQLVVAPVVQASFQPTASLSQTDRGQGGFGSTGV